MNKKFSISLVFFLIFLCTLETRATDTIEYSVDSTEIENASDSNLASTFRELKYTGKFERIFELFEKSPTLVIVLYVVIIYSIITLIILTVFILMNRSRMKKEEELINELNIQYQQLLIDYLFEEENKESIFRNISRSASSQFRRQVLINQIIELSANMQGKAKEDLRKLFLDLGLMRDSLRKATHKKWHQKVKGFRELAYMNIRTANDHILECLNSPNQILRMEAQIALVRLSDDNPYEFLSFLEKPLARWEQITLHELVIQHNLNVPLFGKWFESENLSIVKFSLQMVSWFKQKEAVEDVVKLLSHENEDVRAQAIRTCGDLGMDLVLGELKNRYSLEGIENRKDILETFGKIPNPEYLDFLNEILDTEDDVQLQILATKAMENMDEPGIARLIKLMKSKSEYKNYQIIIRHVLDGRIY